MLMDKTRSSGPSGMPETKQLLSSSSSLFWHTPEAPSVSGTGRPTHFSIPGYSRLLLATRSSSRALIESMDSPVGSVACQTKDWSGIFFSLDCFCCRCSAFDFCFRSSNFHKPKTNHSVCTPAPAAVSSILQVSLLFFLSRRGITSDSRVSQMGFLLRSAEGDSRRAVALEKAVGESRNMVLSSSSSSFLLFPSLAVAAKRSKRAAGGKALWLWRWLCLEAPTTKALVVVRVYGIDASSARIDRVTVLAMQKEEEEGDDANGGLATTTMPGVRNATRTKVSSEITSRGVSFVVVVALSLSLSLYVTLF
mmetsp:Transcript_6598/g.14246  ORF Transcript_6598/g.14246 Transcript_6598/m.14246 type:complete len:308 (-) Transcript_6598:581-1504(-)